MCGIAGLFKRHSQITPDDIGAVRRMMAAQVHRGPTVVFEEKNFSEAELARQMGEQLRTDHREVLVISADFMRELPNISAAMDQPTHDGVNTYFVSKAAREFGPTEVDIAIGVDKLRKRDRISQRELYKALRDTLTKVMYDPFRLLLPVAQSPDSQSLNILTTTISSGLSRTSPSRSSRDR